MALDTFGECSAISICPIFHGSTLSCPALIDSGLTPRVARCVHHTGHQELKHAGEQLLSLQEHLLTFHKQPPRVSSPMSFLSHLVQRD